MKKTVFFLGAGMSAAFGYPVTGDILPLIVSKINRKTLFNDVTRNSAVAAIYRKLLEKLLISLSPGIKTCFTKTKNIAELKKELPLVTELLSQLEFLISANNGLADWNFDLRDPMIKPKKINERWDLQGVKTLFEWAIINVIKSKKQNSSPEIGRFVNWIKNTNQSRRRFISIISTNYDVALEWELLDYGQAFDAGEIIDFGVCWRDTEKGNIYKRPVSPKYKIFKLHGSIDWLKCRRCGYLYINPTQEIYSLTFSNRKVKDNTCHCGYWPLEPILVTMSYIRKMEDANLVELWKNTFEEIRTADEIIIVGYSLPPEDFDIRSMFLRALLSNEKDLQIKVIERSGTSEERYDRFFGKGNYRFIKSNFEDHIPAILNPNLKNKIPFIKAKCD